MPGCVPVVVEVPSFFGRASSRGTDTVLGYAGTWHGVYSLPLSLLVVIPLPWRHLLTSLGSGRFAGAVTISWPPPLAARSAHAPPPPSGRGEAGFPRRFAAAQAPGSKAPPTGCARDGGKAGATQGRVRGWTQSARGGGGGWVWKGGMSAGRCVVTSRRRDVAPAPRAGGVACGGSGTAAPVLGRPSRSGGGGGPQDAGSGGVRQAVGHRQRRLRPPGGLWALRQAGVVRPVPPRLLPRAGGIQGRPAAAWRRPRLLRRGGGGGGGEGSGAFVRERRDSPGPVRSGPVAALSAARPGPRSLGRPEPPAGSGNGAARLLEVRWWFLCLGPPGSSGICGEALAVSAECSWSRLILASSFCNGSLSVSLKWNAFVQMKTLVVSFRWRLFVRWSLCRMHLSLPAITSIILLSCRWIGILALYTVHKGQFNCPGGGLLHSYLLVLLILLASIICALSALVYVSMQGK